MMTNTNITTKMVLERFIKDGKFIEPKLNIAFSKPADKPNIKVTYANQEKIEYKDNCILIDVATYHPHTIAKTILAALEKIGGNEFVCYLHGEIKVREVAQMCIAEYYNFDAITHKGKSPKTINFICNDDKNTETLMSSIDEVKLLGQLCQMVTYMGDTPANFLQPLDIAQIAQDLAKSLNNPHFTVEVIDQEIIKTKMGGIHSVGQANHTPPTMVLVKWTPISGKAPIAIAGKGITFDTGGLSIKPSSGMIGMKKDMLGAANALMTAYAAAKLNMQTNVIAVLACAENAISSNAIKPTDVISIYPRTPSDTASKVNTIEVIDTDAEGRLVLADAFAYIQEHYKPAYIIDIATLTGHMKVILDDTTAGIFSNNSELCNGLLNSAKNLGHRLYELPTGDEIFGHYLKSKVADVANLPLEKSPGSSIAATFLQKFIDKGRPWAHFDIAGVDEVTPYSAFDIITNWLKLQCNPTSKL